MLIFNNINILTNFYNYVCNKVTIKTKAELLQFLLEVSISLQNRGNILSLSISIISGCH